ncbi:hypothetical protein R5W60_21520 (plasmid) [Brucella pseudintermedia]|uniref:hypothetical protein n=1 Tax=Brucella pseudintermedia TaxID=370111 RepID=UPI002AC91AF1|nr:hypothetical protein [Brucella pseudintermedia]WPM83143.1 hypothetical protein R5W60_21520 [Brucella pseudintermedia]
MRDFGQFTQHTEIVELPPQQIGVDDSGQPIFDKPQKQPVLVFRDTQGIDWFDLAKQFPHPFYIAVDESGRIYSMETDFQSSQIAGHLIGIDSDFGFTRGPGGTVYGKIWDGTAIVDPGPLEPALVIVPAVTLWERLSQTEADQVGAAMETQPFRTRQIFLTANTFRSDHELWPLLVSMATELFGEQRASEILAPAL